MNRYEAVDYLEGETGLTKKAIMKLVGMSPQAIYYEKSKNLSIFDEKHKIDKKLSHCVKSFQEKKLDLEYRVKKVLESFSCGDPELLFLASMIGEK